MKSSSENSEVTDLHGKTVLIVDDDRPSLKLLSNYLSGFGIQVLIAGDGLTAVQLANYVLPNLILLDVYMQGLDGFETCRQLKLNEITAQIPVIFITGVADAQSRIRGFEVGGVDYIPKPFQLKEVLTRVTTHLRLAELHRELQQTNATLEQRVKARTADVSKANQRLRAEIAERKRIEQSLKESEELLRVTMENISDPVFITDASGRFTFIGPNAPQALGYTVEEIAVMGNISQLIGDNLFDPADLAERGELRNIERVISGKNGQEKTYLITVKRVSIKAGTVLYTCRDVTERKLAEQALRQSEARFRAVWEVASDAMLLTDPAGVVLLANPAYEELYGYSLEIVIGYSFAKIYPPEQRTAAVEQYRTVFDSRGIPPVLEAQIRRADGALCEVEAHISFLTKDGQREAMLSTIRDVTEQKRALQQIGYQASLVDNVSDAIISTDTDYIIKSWNKAAERIYGWQTEAVMGRPVAEVIKTVYPNQSRADIVKQFLSEGYWEGENWQETKSGRRLIIWSKVSLITDGQGNPVEAVAVNRDITERKLAEEALQRTVQRLELMRNLDRAILSSLSPTDIAEAALKGIHNLIPCQQTSLSLFDYEQDQVLTMFLKRESQTIVTSGTSVGRMQEFFKPGRIQTEQPNIVEDLRTLPESTPILQMLPDEGIRSFISVPLNVHDEVLGMLDLGFEQPAAFSEEDIEIVQEIANQLSVALRQARLFSAEREQRLQAESLREVTLALTAQIELDAVLDEVLTQARRVTPYRAANIALIQNEIIEVVRWRGYEWLTDEEKPGGKIHLLVDLPADQRVVETGQPQVVQDTHRAGDWIIYPESSWIRSYVAVPIRWRDEIFGVLRLDGVEPNEFSRDDAKRLKPLAGAAAVALANAQLYEEVQRYAAELEQRVAERTAELREQYQKQATIEERQRLARDLHDAVSQTLFSASLLAEAVPRLWTRYPEQARQSLTDLRRLNRGALAEMRNLLRELRPAALIEASLTELLRHLTDALAGRTKVEVSLQVQEPSELSPEVKVALYRISQEALNNIAKHARAGQVQIHLGHDPDELKLTIRDDGRGFDPHYTSANHMGLIIMRERAEAIGAALNIDSRPGRGTEIIVRRPNSD